MQDWKKSGANNPIFSVKPSSGAAGTDIRFTITVETDKVVWLRTETDDYKAADKTISAVLASWNEFRNTGKTLEGSSLTIGNLFKEGRRIPLSTGTLPPKQRERRFFRRRRSGLGHC